MSKNAPKAEDPKITAAAQAGYNKTAAQDTKNMAWDRQGLFGASTIDRDAKGNAVGMTNSLSPGMQTAADNVVGAVGSQTGLLPNTAFNPNTDAAGIRQAFVGQGMQYAQPEWARQDKNREITMTNRGIPIGSEAWTDAENQVGESRNQYMGDLSNRAWQAGANEEQRQFGNQLTQYQLPQQMAAGGMGLLSGMNSLTPQAQEPNANVGSVDYGGMVQAKHASDTAAHNAKMQGFGQLAGAGAAILAAPMTGGTSLAGMMASNMFNTPK